MYERRATASEAKGRETGESQAFIPVAVSIALCRNPNLTALPTVSSDRSAILKGVGRYDTGDKGHVKRGKE